MVTAKSRFNLSSPQLSHYSLLDADGVDATDGEKFWEACELQRLDLSFNQIAQLPCEV